MPGAHDCLSCALCSQGTNLKLALCFYAIMAVTDFLDGQVARRTQTVSWLARSWTPSWTALPLHQGVLAIVLPAGGCPRGSRCSSQAEDRYLGMAPSSCRGSTAVVPLTWSVHRQGHHGTSHVWLLRPSAWCPRCAWPGLANVPGSRPQRTACRSWHLLCLYQHRVCSDNHRRHLPVRHSDSPRGAFWNIRRRGRAVTSQQKADRCKALLVLLCSLALPQVARRQYGYLRPRPERGAKSQIVEDRL